MTERYHRRDFGHLDVEVTFQDQAVYSRPWTATASAVLAPDTEMLEFVCNEGGFHAEHWIGKASDERKGEKQVAPEILAKYVGTFVELPPFWRTVARVVEITLTDGRLYGDMDGRGKEPLIASSDTEFSGLYGLGVEFIPGSSGGLFVKHVSGNYRFARK